MRELFAAAVGGRYESINAHIDNYWRGHWVKHPVATNMHGLPANLIVDIIRDYVDAKKIESPVITNYEEWLVASYGRTYAETFPMQYTRKYHTTEARNLTTDWVGPRLYQAKSMNCDASPVASRPTPLRSGLPHPTEGGFCLVPP